MAVTRRIKAPKTINAVSRPAPLLAVFTATIFLSAALLFAVQPLFAKIVLPVLGGSPSVWSVAMVFFQATLLAGYAYAHVLTRGWPGRPSVIVHVIVMLAATLALPLGMASGWGRPPAEAEAPWLLGLFAASIGLPFFALSANAPLLQAWFARTGHPSAKDPYFLYAASNVGSFAALLGYPFLIEPFTRLGEQTRVWSYLFYALIGLIAICGMLLLQSRNALPRARRNGAQSEAAPQWRDALIWVALAAVPSAFLIAVTAHISTDVAAAPLLWVLPLALYLLTFVIVFQTNPIIPHGVFVAIQPAVIAILIAVIIFDDLHEILIIIGANLAAFFVTAMVCHGELARRRPPARYLTEFYLWMSAGGVIGGIAAGLIAPNVFNWVAEYPLLIVAGLLCRPGFRLPQDRDDWLTVAAIAAAAVLTVLAVRYMELFASYVVFNWTVMAVLAAAILFFAQHAIRLAGAVGVVLLAVNLYYAEGTSLETIRSFFGVNKIYETADGEVRVLMHGTTIHGAQRIRDGDGNPITTRPEPITYFTSRSPMALAFAAAQENKRGPIRAAVVGLGAGSVACYMRPEDTLHFFEIDRVVVRIATDPSKFTYISGCHPDSRIILGDARLTLADAPDNYYDLIVMDAFSSDAVPVHLLTREAMALYLKKLAPGGMVVSHVMNRHMELASVVAGIAHANGLVARLMHFDEPGDEPYVYGSSVAAVARREEDFGALLRSGNWEKLEPDPKQWVWTDDYSNIVGAIIRHMR